MIKTLFRRITHSARDEAFNPLTYPFLLSTLAYGIGFLFFTHSRDVGSSSLFIAMYAVSHSAPQIWGFVAVATIIIGLTFLLFNKPPAGRTSGLTGFMVWVFASMCWALSGVWLIFFAVGVPNMIFWIWQYLSLSRFKHEDDEDAESERLRVLRRRKRPR